MASSFTLGEHFEDLIEALVSTGRYASASDVMRDGLRLLEAREQVRETKLAALKADIREGLDSGPAEGFDMAAVKVAARQQWNAKRSDVHGA